MCGPGNWGNLPVALDPGLMGDRGLIRERMQAVLDRCGGVVSVNICGSVDLHMVTTICNPRVGG